MDFIKESKFYIDAIEFGIKNVNSGYTFNEFCSHMESKKHRPNNKSDDPAKHTWHRIYIDLSFPSNEGGDKRFLNPDFYFSYLDYYELKEARKSSRTAMISASLAIIISILGVYLQYSNSVEVKEAQFNKLIGVIERINKVPNK
jgi:hypothetical protein